MAIIDYVLMTLCVINMAGVIFFLYNSRGLHKSIKSSRVFQMHKTIIRLAGLVEGLYFLSYFTSRIIAAETVIHTTDLIYIVAELSKNIFFSIAIYFTIAWLMVKKKKDRVIKEEWNRCFLNN